MARPYARTDHEILPKSPDVPTYSHVAEVLRNAAATSNWTGVAQALTADLAFRNVYPSNGYLCTRLVRGDHPWLTSPVLTFSTVGPYVTDERGAPYVPDFYVVWSPEVSDEDGPWNEDRAVEYMRGQGWL